MCFGNGNVDMPTPDEIGQAQARYNRVDQYTPYGSVQFSGPDRNVMTQTLTPEMQQLQGAMMGVRSGALSQLLERFGALPMNLQNPETGDPWTPQRQDTYKEGYTDSDGLPMPDWTGGDPAVYAEGKGLQAGRGGIGGGGNPFTGGGSDPFEDPPRFGVTPSNNGPPGYQGIDLPYDLNLDDMGGIVQNRGRLEDAYFQRAKGLLDPVFADQQTALDERMANRGMPTGGEEGEILQRRLGTERGGAYEKAALDAILYGGSETRADRQQTLGERMSQFGASSHARSQLFGEDSTQFNQLASVLGLAPAPSAAGDLPSFFGPGQIDMMSPYALQQQAQQANQGFGSDFLGGLLGLGGQLGAAAICDINLKKDFVAIDEDGLLEKLSAIPISAWRYKTDVDTDRHIGPMAQDFNKEFGAPINQYDFEAIDMISAVGVLMASVKALKRRVDELEGR